MTDSSEDGGQWHMIPITEVAEHDHDEDCWCEPEFQGETPEGCQVFLHFSKTARTLQ